MNWIDPWGLCRKKGETVWQCASRSAREALGDGVMDTIDSLGWWGLIPAISAVGGSTANKMAGEVIKSSGTAGAAAGGDIYNKMVAADKAYRQAGRMKAYQNFFKLSGVLGVIATSESVIYRGLGYYFGDCFQECPDYCE